MILEYIKAVLYGILEGITEWLPVSSTGHLILLDELLALNVAPKLGPTFAAEYWSMFEVMIQLGAILAVVVMFFGKLNPFSSKKSGAEKKGTWILWGKVCLASIPAAAIGIVLDKVIEKVTGKDIDGWLYNWQVVACALVVYGVLFIIMERLQRGRENDVSTVDDISCRQAMWIGCFQALAIVPGTSRSGSTILGSRLMGISRPAAAEFSFFMGIPAMAGASLLKGAGFMKYVWEADASVPVSAWLVLLVAAAVAFLVSMVAIRFLMEFVKRHSFAPFGVYRIVLGVLVTVWFLLR